MYTWTDMVRLNVCLTGVEGRELWFSRGIEEILNRYQIVVKGHQHDIFREMGCLNVWPTGVDGRELWFSQGIQSRLISKNFELWTLKGLGFSTSKHETRVFFRIAKFSSLTSKIFDCLSHSPWS
jgi:hypothetical protein